jgi:hypothetical protein
MRDPSWMDGPPGRECYLCGGQEEGYDARGDWNEWGDAHESCEQEMIELLQPGQVMEYNGRSIYQD